MSLLFDLWLSSRLSAAYLDDAMQDAELSPIEYGLYSLLGAYGPTTARQVLRWTGMPTTTVSAMITRMDDRGHLERTPNPDDGRSWLLSLSDEGQAAMDRSRGHFRPALDEVIERLGDAAPRVHAALRALDAVLRAALGVEPHPGTAGDGGGDGTGGAVLIDVGGPLSPGQEDEVRRYVAWIRHRDSTHAA